MPPTIKLDGQALYPDMHEYLSPTDIAEHEEIIGVTLILFNRTSHVQEDVAKELLDSTGKVWVIEQIAFNPSDLDCPYVVVEYQAVTSKLIQSRNQD